MHSKIISIEKKEEIFDTYFIVFGTLFLFSPLFSIILDTFLNQYIIFGLLAGIGLIGMYFSVTGLEFYSKAVLKMVMGEEMKQFSDNPYREFRNLVKNFKKEIREEGILEKDFDEAFYLRMKYFFEDGASDRTFPFCSQFSCLSGVFFNQRTFCGTYGT